MNIIVNNIKVPYNTNINDVYEKAIKLSKLSKNNICDMCIHKKSIDARGGNILSVYSVNIKLNKEENIKPNSDVLIYKEEVLKLEKGKALLKSRPIIIGFGPAGLFCSYLLCLYGYKPIIFEQGNNIDIRTKDVDTFFKGGLFNPKSNIQFGEGGAGTFSDGKLTTRISDKRCALVMKAFNKFGADESILYEAHPHIGTDKLKKIIKNMRNFIVDNGGDIHFNTKITDLIIKDNNIKGVITEYNDKILSENVVLAIGHSSRDTYKMLYSHNIFMEKKPFSVGFRIEHKKEFINFGRYGKNILKYDLPAAEYQFSYREKERGCYTFCMCPGGSVIASNSEENTVVTNGMSESRRNAENSNSAVVASVLPSDLSNDIFSGLIFQQKLERKAFEFGGKNYYAPAQLSKDYLNNNLSRKISDVTPSYLPGINLCNFNDIFPDKINSMLLKGLQSFDTKIKGFSTGNGILTGIETRTSAPLRITRDENFYSVSVNGLFPAGEGAGYAGGIVSAAVDGIRIAEKIIETYKPLNNE